MKQLEGFITEGKEHLVCKLKKSIYGLKQSPHCWNTALYHQLKQMGFTQSTQAILAYAKMQEMCFILEFMLTILSLQHKMTQIKRVKDALSQKFDIKDLGKLYYFLGIKTRSLKIFGLANQLTLTTFLENLASKSTHQFVHLLILVQNL